VPTQTAAEASLERRQGEIDALYRKLESTQKDGDAAEHALEAQRQAAVQAEREVQEAGYVEKDCISKISEIDRSSKVVLEHVQNAERSLEQLQVELAGVDDQVLRAQLQQGLATRLAREQTLAGGAQPPEEIAGTLRSSERRATRRRAEAPAPARAHRGNAAKGAGGANHKRAVRTAASRGRRR